MAGSLPITVLLYVLAHADEEALHLGGEKLALAALLERFGQAPAHLRIALVSSMRVEVAWRGMVYGDCADVATSW